MSRPYLVVVAWDDSTMIMSDGWERIPSVLKRRARTRCHSIGFVLADDKRGVVLAASVHGSQVAGVTIIPRRQIVSRRRLR